MFLSNPANRTEDRQPLRQKVNPGRKHHLLLEEVNK